MPKSWQEKLADDKNLPKVIKIKGKLAARWGTGTMVIPALREVDAIMRRVRKGKLITINEICFALAKRHSTTLACPMTTGIFAWIAAHAAEEGAGGRRAPTPYWRTLKAGGELNPKYPGGLKALSRKLRSEGHRVTVCGKRMFVADFGESLAKL